MMLSAELSHQRLLSPGHIHLSTRSTPTPPAPSRKFKSRSLPSFDTNDTQSNVSRPSSKQGKANTNTSGQHLHKKRRDQILQNFIKETERKYGVCLSGKDTNDKDNGRRTSGRKSVKGSSYKGEVHKEKVIRFTSITPRPDTAETLPDSTMTASKGERALYSPGFGSRGKETQFKGTRHYGSTVEYSNDSLLSPRQKQHDNKHGDVIPKSQGRQENSTPLERGITDRVSNDKANTGCDVRSVTQAFSTDCGVENSTKAALLKQKDSKVSQRSEVSNGSIYKQTCNVDNSCNEVRCPSKNTLKFDSSVNFGQNTVDNNITHGENANSGNINVKNTITSSDVRRKHRQQQIAAYNQLPIESALHCNNEFAGKTIPVKTDLDIKGLNIHGGIPSDKQLVSSGAVTDKAVRINKQDTIAYEDNTPYVSGNSIDYQGKQQLYVDNYSNERATIESFKSEKRGFLNTPVQPTSSIGLAFSKKGTKVSEDITNNQGQETVRYSRNVKCISTQVNEPTNRLAVRSATKGRIVPGKLLPTPETHQRKLLASRGDDESNHLGGNNLNEHSSGTNLNKRFGALSDASRKLSDRLKQGNKPPLHNNRLSSRSDESFINSQGANVVIQTPVVSAGDQVVNLSTRSVYLSSQSCENFANYDKNDFKAALRRLKGSSVTSGSRLQPVVVNNNRDLYDINEQEDSSEHLHNKSNKENIHSTYQHNYARHGGIGVATSPKGPHLASVSQEYLEVNLPKVKNQEQITAMHSMPSYTVPLKSGASSVGSHPYGNPIQSENVFMGGNKGITFDRPLTLQMRDEFNRQNTSSATTSALHYSEPSGHLRGNVHENAKYGTTPTQNVNNRVEMESPSQRSETCSTGSGYSDNLADDQYVDQYFSHNPFTSDNSNQNAISRPKSSKGRERAGKVYQEIPKHTERTSLSHSNIDRGESQLKSRPKSAKGRGRNTMIFSETDAVKNHVNQKQVDIEQTDISSNSNSRPKSARWRSRNITDVEVSSTNIESQINENFSNNDDVTLRRPQSSKGRSRQGYVPASENKTNKSEMTKLSTTSPEKTNIHIDSLPFDPYKKVSLNRKQQRRHISSFMNIETLSSKPPAKAKAQNERFCKPQTDLDVDSGNDTDVDGEIEILDLDAMDSGDELVPREDSRNGVGSNTTIGSRSSKGSSETSTTAWEQHHYGSNNNNNLYIPNQQQKQTQQQNTLINYGYHGNEGSGDCSDTINGHDAFLLDTPRFTAKEMNTIKARNHDLINRVSMVTNSRQSVHSKSENNLAGSLNMQLSQKSQLINSSTAVNVDLNLRGGPTEVSQPSKKSNLHVNNMNSRDKLGLGDSELMGPPCISDIKLSGGLYGPIKPRKLEPIRQKKVPNDSNKSGGGFMLHSASAYEFRDVGRGTKNPSQISNIFPIDHVTDGGIHTKPQKARNNKKSAKRIDKMTIIHGDLPDNLSGSDSPGYITDGSLCFEYSNSSFRRMSDRC